MEIVLKDKIKQNKNDTITRIFFFYYLPSNYKLTPLILQRKFPTVYKTLRM